MTSTILAALLREYTTQLDTELYKLNAQEPPPKKRVWVKNPPSTMRVPSPDWNIFPPNKDTPSELWEWVDDTEYIQPRYRALLAIVERMKEFEEEIKEGTDVTSKDE